MKKTIALLLLLPLVATLATGCFFKGNGGGAASPAVEPSRIVRDTNVDPATVQVNRLPDGNLKVSWKTKSPAAGGYVLAANLFFEERPLYSKFAKEAAAAPTLEHEAVVPAAPGSKTKIGIAYGENELTDNGGLGFSAE